MLLRLYVKINHDGVIVNFTVTSMEYYHNLYDAQCLHLLHSSFQQYIDILLTNIEIRSLTTAILKASHQKHRS